MFIFTHFGLFDKKYIFWPFRPKITYFALFENFHDFKKWLIFYWLLLENALILHNAHMCTCKGKSSTVNTSSKGASPRSKFLYVMALVTEFISYFKYFMSNFMTSH